MKIIPKNRAIHLKKPEGIDVWYYLFNEYEIHYNEQSPGTKQAWHFHKKINETLFLIEGKLTIRWNEGSKEKKHNLNAGDIVEVENSEHSFENNSNKIAKFLIIKQVLSGRKKSKIFKSDKFIKESK